MFGLIKYVLATAFAVAILGGVGVAQSNYPNQPIKIIVPYAAGGGTDVVLRLYQKALEDALGGSVYAEYDGGAATLIGTKKALGAKPDGYTLLLTTSAIALNTILLPGKPYQMSDFDIIAPLAQYPYALFVNDSQSFSDLDGFIKYAKANPGALNYIHLGKASPTRLLAERLAHELDVKLTPVAYPGSGPAQTDFYANRVQMQMASATEQYVKGPNTRIIAVAGAERVPYLPDVPTFKELGYPEMVGGTWFGLFAPAGLPVDILTKLREAAKKAETNIKADLEAVGHYPVPGGLEGFDKYIEADLAQWRIDLTRIGETVY